jgi:oligopeptide/dipeptide ABC transporter ATP-binding protein
MTAPPVGRRVLEVEDLAVSFSTDRGELPVVNAVSFDILESETVALVGESGCGKSVTALAVMGLIDEPGRIVRGSIRLDDKELVGATETELQKVRGRRIGMIFQEPMTSLNPVFTIGAQIAEVFERHFNLTAKEIRDQVRELLEKVGIASPDRRMDQYPHELSGGMKQRVMIAMALACKPDLLIADEPTTALDVTIQAQILNLLAELQKDMGMAILLITHNLSVVARFAQRVVVMYAGEIAETADVRSLFREPQHPYTRALLAALPSPHNVGERLNAIKGTVPIPLDYPRGCRFATRCQQVLADCAKDKPRMIEQSQGHRVACWLFENSG